MSSRCFLACLLSLSLLGSNAHAQDIDACVDAAEASQRQRGEGKYLDARQNLILCARAGCPAVIVAECTRDIAALDAAIPTVVFSVAGLTAEQTAGVRVRVESRPEELPIDGKPVPIDPGWHVVTFQLPTGATDQLRVLAKVGEKNRLVELVRRPEKSKTIQSPGSGDARREAAPNWLGYSLITGGSLLVGGGAFFWVHGRGDLQDLRDGCGATASCEQGDVDDARRTILIGDVLAGAGIVMAGIGTYLLVSGSSEIGGTQVEVGTAVTPSSHNLIVRGSF